MASWVSTELAIGDRCRDQESQTNCGRPHPLALRVSKTPVDHKLECAGSLFCRLRVLHSPGLAVAPCKWSGRTSSSIGELILRYSAFPTTQWSQTLRLREAQD